MIGSRQYLFVLSDLVQPQDLDGQMQPVLGSSVEDSNSWVPLASTYVPSAGWLRFSSVLGQPINRMDNVVIWIEIAPINSIRKV